MKLRRRTYLINKPFQLGHMANVLLLHLASVAVSGALIAWISVIVLNRRLVCGLDAMFMVKIGIILLVVAVGVVLWAIKSSHAIAGPVWKAGRIMRQAADGDIPAGPVTFRKGDNFKELAEDMNRLLDAYRNDQDRLAALRRELGTLSDSYASGAITAVDFAKAVHALAE